MVRGGKGDGCVMGFEECTERLGWFVVDVEVCDGVMIGVKKLDDVGEGGAVGGRGAGGLWFKVDASIVDGDKEAFMAQTGWNRITTGQVRG